MNGRRGKGLIFAIVLGARYRTSQPLNLSHVLPGLPFAFSHSLAWRKEINCEGALPHAASLGKRTRREVICQAQYVSFTALSDD